MTAVVQVRLVQLSAPHRRHGWMNIADQCNLCRVYTFHAGAKNLRGNYSPVYPSARQQSSRYFWRVESPFFLHAVYACGGGSLDDQRRFQSGHKPSSRLGTNRGSPQYTTRNAGMQNGWNRRATRPATKQRSPGQMYRICPCSRASGWHGLLIAACLSLRKCPSLFRPTTCVSPGHCSHSIRLQCPPRDHPTAGLGLAQARATRTRRSLPHTAPSGHRSFGQAPAVCLGGVCWAGSGAGWTSFRRILGPWR